MVFLPPGEERVDRQDVLASGGEAQQECSDPAPARHRHHLRRHRHEVAPRLAPIDFQT
jgi:hypothetical protein